MTMKVLMFSIFFMFGCSSEAFNGRWVYEINNFVLFFEITERNACVLSGGTTFELIGGKCKFSNIGDSYQITFEDKNLKNESGTFIYNNQQDIIILSMPALDLKDVQMHRVNLID